MSIDRRAFIVAVGIDKFIFNELEDEPSLNKQINRYEMTFAIPNLQKVVGEQGLSDEPRFVKTSVGPTFINTYKNLEGRINKNAYFGHTKAILLGKELLKDKTLLKETLDILQRNNQFSRSIPVVSVDGTAKEALMANADMQPLIGIYISELFENNEGVNTRFEQRTLGDLLKDFKEDKGAIIPKLSIGEKDIKIAGAALVKDYELKGWLDEYEVRGMLWIKKNNQRLEVSIPYKHFYIAYHVSNSKSKITFYKEEEDIVCRVLVEAEGRLEEYILDENILDNKEIEKVEDAIEKSIKEEIENSIHILQKQYNTDVINIGKELERQDPKQWELVKDNWDEVFEKMKFDINVSINIRRIGQIK